MDDGELEEVFFDEIETIAGKIYLGKIGRASCRERV